MAYTLADLRTEIKIDLDDDSIENTILTQFLNDVNRYICNSRRWRFMEKTFKGAVTIGTANYSLPTDFQQSINLRLVDPDGYAAFLEYMNFEQFNERYPDPGALPNALPSIWTMFGTGMTLGPAAPDLAYVLELNYLKKPTELVADADVPNVPLEFKEALKLGVRSKYMERDDSIEAAQLLWQEFIESLDVMTARLENRQVGSPHIMRTTRRRTRPFA